MMNSKDVSLPSRKIIITLVLALLPLVAIASLQIPGAHAITSVTSFVPAGATRGVATQFTATIASGTATTDRPVTVLWEMTNDATTNNGLWDSGESVIYDSNANSKFDTAETVIAGPTPPNLAITKDDPKIRFVDTSGDSAWESPEPVIYDTNGDTMYSTNEPVIAGATPAVGTATLDDAKIRFVDADTTCVVGTSGFTCQAVWTFALAGTTSVKAIAVNSAGTASAARTQSLVVSPPPPLSLQPATTDVLFPGQVFVVSLVVGDPANPTVNPVNDLDGWEITVTYNPAILTATGVGPANTICSGGACTGADYGSDALFSSYSVFRDPTLDDVSGTVIMGATFVTFPPVGPSGNGVLAQFNFVFDAPGGTSASLHIGDNKLRSVAVGAINVVTPSMVHDASATASGTLNFSPITAVQGVAQTFTAAATGGTPPYTFTWDFGDGTPTQMGTTTSHTFAAVGPFPVSLTLSDSAATPNTGSIIKTVTVTPPVGPALCSQAGSCDFTFTPASPIVGATVTLTATAAGGTGPYTFSWNFGDGSAVATGNPIGHSFPSKGTKTVKLTITDSATPTHATFDVTHSITVNPVNPLAVTVSCPAKVVAGTPFNCTVSATGGTMPYTGTGSISRTLSTKTTATGTTVSFDVTDANAKLATGTATVVVNPANALAVTASCPAKVVAGTAFNCTVSATGGTAPYTGTGSISRTLTTKTTATGTSVTFSVTDANGKVASGSATVVVNSATPLAVTASCPAKVVASTAFNCTVSATGGTSPYTGTGSISRTLSTKTTATGTTVSFDVTDANGKVATGTATVVVNPATPLAVTVTCPAKVTAGVAFNCTVAATGGTSPYTGTGSQSKTIPTPSASATVTFSVTDANGKVASGSTTTVVNAPVALTVTVVCPAKVVAGTAFNCTVSATGGTPPYTGTGTISRTLSTKTTAAGTLVTFTVTDSLSASAQGSATVVVNPTTPLAVTVTCPAKVTAGVAFNCTVAATGGTTPYTGTGSKSATIAMPSASATVTFSVTDANGKVAPGSTTTVVNAPTALTVTVSCPAKVVAGTAFNCDVSATGGTPPYTGTGSISRTLSTKTTAAGTSVTFTVTDSLSASAQGSATVVVNSVTPLAVTVTCPAKVIAGVSFNCTVAATGGTTPYTGTGSQSKTISMPSASATVTFSVTDANGKVASGQTTVVVNAPTGVTVTVVCPAKVIAGTAFNCTVSATGGTPPYTGTGTISRTLSTKTTAAGTSVTFTVMDSLGASAQGSATVVVNPVNSLAVTVSCPAKVVAGTPFSCTVAATGGTAPYTGTGSISRTLSTKTTATGTTVSFDVTDANGKVATGTANVVVNPASPLAGDFGFAPASPTVGSEVTFTATISGGTTPYSYSWSFGDGGTAIVNPARHTYNTKGSKTVGLTVTDANNVPLTISHTVAVNPLTLTVGFSSSPSSPVVGQTVTFTAVVTGGTLPYTFSWNFGDTATGNVNPATHSYTSPGSVTVQLTVTDANGATADASHSITISPISGARSILTFDAFDADAFENGVGELDVSLNSVHVINIPAELQGLTGTGTYEPYDDVWVSFGPFDITSSIQQGVNTLVFENPLDSHFSAIRNVRVVQGDTLLLFSSRSRSIEPGVPVILTFSVPPLVLTSFTVTPSIVFKTEPVTFTATFTGGTAPFKCRFTFGDGDGKTIITNSNSCSATHTYFSAPRLRTATVRVRGSTLADDVRGQLQVMVEPQPGYGEDGLTWDDEIQLGDPQVFMLNLTNPASITVLIRVDLAVIRPDGSTQLFISPSFLLNSGQTLTDTFNYVPASGVGEYCFKAPLSYGVDMNGDNILQDSEVLGHRGARSGCFTVDGNGDNGNGNNAGVNALGPSIFIGALLPAGRNTITNRNARMRKTSRVSDNSPA